MALVHTPLSYLQVIKNSGQNCMARLDIHKILSERLVEHQQDLEKPLFLSL